MTRLDHLVFLRGSAAFGLCPLLFRKLFENGIRDWFLANTCVKCDT